jgi:hypothetical protein
MKLFQLVFIIALSNSILGQNTIQISGVEWQMEDSKITNFVNGDPIFNAQTPKQWFDYCDQMEPCYMITTRGNFLYNYFALVDDRGFIPKGFRIFNENDFGLLLTYIIKKSGSDFLPVQYLMNYNYSIVYWDEKADELTDKEVQGNNWLGFNAEMSGFIDSYGHWCGIGGDTEVSKKYSEIWDVNTEMPCSYWWIINSEGRYGVLNIGHCSQDPIGEGSGGGYNVLENIDTDETMKIYTMGFSIRLVADPRE